MSQTMNLQWQGAHLAEQADRAFRKTLAVVGVPFLLFAILVFFIKLDIPRAPEQSYVPPATVELLPSEDTPEQEPAPQAPKEEEPAPAKQDRPEPPKQAAPVKVEKPKVVEKVTPVPVPVPVDPTLQAREVAKKTGVLAFADQLNELRNKGDVATNQSLSSNVLSSKGATGTPAAGGGDGGAGALSAATAGSAGIGGAGSDGVSSQQSGQGLGKRRTSKVASPVGFGRDKAKSEGSGSGGKRGGRSQDEIQLVFDRAQGSFYAMYLRALRENAQLAGKVILSVTIAPAGNVIDARIVSSELGDPELEGKILSKVRSLNFGAKDVPDFTYPNYRIKFQPPN